MHNTFLLSYREDLELDMVKVRVELAEGNSEHSLDFIRQLKNKNDWSYQEERKHNYITEHVDLNRGVLEVVVTSNKKKWTTKDTEEMYLKAMDMLEKARNEIKNKTKVITYIRDYKVFTTHTENVMCLTNDDTFFDTIISLGNDVEDEFIESYIDGNSEQEIENELLEHKKLIKTILMEKINDLEVDTII